MTEDTLPTAYSKKGFWIVQVVGFGPILFMLIAALLPGALLGFREATGTLAILAGVVLPLFATLYDLGLSIKTRRSKPIVFGVLGILWLIFIVMVWVSSPTPGP